MAKPRTVFVCQECGSQSPKWLGRCSDCGAWNSFVEERQAPRDADVPTAATHRYARGERLHVGQAPLYLLAETCLERILEEIARIRPALVIVDSVQTIFSLKFQSAPGSIGQVREAATQLLFTAKGQNVPTFLVGHVTKDGSLAGPKALEHVVDTVLYFEGERHHSHRVVRAVKNRFGAVSELGVFEMTAAGLVPIANPSKLFLAERPANAAGSSVLCAVEGTRLLLVEVQASSSTRSYGVRRGRSWRGSARRRAGQPAHSRG